MQQKVIDALKSNVTINFLAGGMAGCVSRTVVSPLERMKILFQIQTPGSQAYRGVWPTLVKMWKEEGWRGYMRGNGSNCLRIFPYSAIQFASYNIYKPFFLYQGETELSVLMKLVAGGLAGVTSVAFTYPLDITRTRLSIQCADFANLPKHEQAALPGMWGIMKQIYKQEGGMRGLYRGIMPTVYGVAPYVGINFAVYESVRKHFVIQEGGEPTALQKLASGAISGGVAQFMTYPFDVLRRRFQVNMVMGNGYTSVWHACRTIAAKEGLKGFYKGLAANLLKVVPSMSSSWLTFEMTRSYLLKL
jgi:solute carrier family 25 phosphate transporter 23/24/25/41